MTEVKARMVLNIRHLILSVFSSMAVVLLLWSANGVSGTSANVGGGYLGIPGLVKGEGSPWARIKTPSNGSPKVIGAVSNGCIAGAEILPEQGAGFVSIRRHRNRFYGHPSTIDLIEDLGAGLAKRTDQLMMVGDLSQPRGGRMSSMHRSHQNGMDVDIWLSLAPSAKAAHRSTANKKDPPTMVAPNKLAVNDHWGKYQHYLIKAAAQHPKVDRIFINPAIKQELCKTEKGDRGYLRKLRPWRGHDAHFHVRLKCPKGSPNCEQQRTIPMGDGCESLAKWFKPRPKSKKPIVRIGRPITPKKRLPPPMAPECVALLKKSYEEQGNLAQK